jgi:hypothetical protein
MIAREPKHLEAITQDLMSQQLKGDQEKSKGAWLEGSE